MLAITNAKMADAMRTITVEQGIDPRVYSLVAFGGAGPMHAAWLARELDICEVIIPRFPGTFYAWGMLQTDVRRDITHTFYRLTQQVTTNDIAQVYQQLQQEGTDAPQVERIAPEEMYFVRSADMRYIGQEYAVNVDIGETIDISTIAASFHTTHQTRYGHSTPVAPIEFVNLRLAAQGRLQRKTARFAVPDGEQDPFIASRDAIFDGTAYPTPVLCRDWIRAGAEYSGPLIIEEDSATAVVPPGYHVRLDEQGNIIVTVE